MPNEKDNDDSKTNQDKNTEDVKTSEGDKNQDNNKEEVITIKKSELDKIKSDRDNYKNIGLQKKAGDRDLKVKTDDQGEDNINEKKIEATATIAANKVMREASEKSAKRAFLNNHPEYLDDTEWNQLMSNLTFKGGEIFHDEIIDRMEAALLEHKRSTGKLEEYLKSEREKGVLEGRIQAGLGSGGSMGGVGDKNEKSSGEFSSPKGDEMARSMHVDPEKAKKIDLTRDNVIQII